MKISIITPTLNEEANIEGLVRYLSKHGGDHIAEIIVVDANSKDNTATLAEKAGAVVLHSPHKCRAKQMNLGTRHASGNILWFVHADTLPPASFVEDIQKSLDSGFEIGGYRFQFDSKRISLKIQSWFTRFDLEFCRGGDQSLFLSRDLFDQLQGYDEEYIIMEEYDLIRRARQITKFRIIPKSVIVSARKYDENTWLQVNKANLKAFKMYKKGESPAKIKETYYRMIRHPKAE